MYFVKPDDSNMLDLRDFKTNPNDPDEICNTAFLEAFKIAAVSRNSAPRQIFIPNGIHIVTDTIYSRIGVGGYSDGWRHSMLFVGESVTGSTIYVPPNSANFQDPLNPKAVIYTGSEEGATQPYPPNPTGKGNIGFRHYLKNLTIEIGENNPGAIGIDYLSHNRCGIYFVRIIDRGNSKIGLALVRDGVGPGIIKHLYIEGFDYGIYEGFSLTDISRALYQYHHTFKNITFRNQRVKAMRANGLAFSINGCISYNDVQAFDFESLYTQATLININLFRSSFIAPKSGVLSNIPTSKVDVVGIRNAAVLRLENLTNHAYQTTLVDQRVNLTSTDTFIKEHFSSITPPLFPGVPSDFSDIAAKPVPNIYPTIISDQENVNNYKLDTDTNPVQWIQRAFDNSTAKILYIPNGNYRLNNTLYLRGNVEKFYSFEAQLSRVTGFTGTAVVNENSSAKQIILEHFRFDGIINNASKPLILINSQVGNLTIGNQGLDGTTFIEDCITLVNSDKYHHFYCYQLNCEFTGINFRMVGGIAYIEGFKTEGLKNPPSIHMQLEGGARVKCMNAVFLPLQTVTNAPAIRIIDSQLEISYKIANGAYANYTIEETRRGVTRQKKLDRTGLYKTTKF